MTGLSRNLSGKPTPTEKLERARRVDKTTAFNRFHDIWNLHIGKQREWARDTGSFKKASGEGWNANPTPSGFVLKFEFKGEVSTVKIRGEWNRKTAKASFEEWTNP